MTIQMPAPGCEKCGTAGVASYLVLSTTLQYWRCPDCARIWTTVKSAIEQHQQAYAKTDPGASARTHCPQCGTTEVIDLRDILHSARADYFRCRVCQCWWFVPAGQNGPAARVIFGDPQTGSKDQDKAG